MDSWKPVLLLLKLQASDFVIHVVLPGRRAHSLLKSGLKISEVAGGRVDLSSTVGITNEPRGAWANLRGRQLADTKLLLQISQRGEEEPGLHWGSGGPEARGYWCVSPQKPQKILIFM